MLVAELWKQCIEKIDEIGGSKVALRTILFLSLASI